MGNCLVTKLKGSVDADLLKLGEMRIKCSTAACGGTTTEAMRAITFSAMGTSWILTAGGRTFKAKKDSDANYQEVTEWAPEGGTRNNFIFPDGEYEISILGKYNVSEIIQSASSAASEFFSIDLSDFEFSSELYLLNGRPYSLHGELKTINFTTPHSLLVKIEIADYRSPVSTDAYIDIDKLCANGCQRLGSIYVYESTRFAGTPQYSKHSRGSINVIDSLVLTNLLINGTEITGDIDTMIQNMIAAGRTSGNFYTQGNNFVTVKGTPFNTWLETLPGTGGGVTFTIDPTAPDGWTAVRE